VQEYTEWEKNGTRKWPKSISTPDTFVKKNGKNNKKKKKMTIHVGPLTIETASLAGTSVLEAWENSLFAGKEDLVVCYRIGVLLPTSKQGFNQRKNLRRL